MRLGGCCVERIALAVEGVQRLPPTRQWGADPDQQGLRRVAGRKFYWPSWAPANERHLGKAHHSPSMKTDVQLLKAGQWLQTTLHFENLSDVEIGALISAVAPHLLLESNENEGGHITSRLCGGKPFGMGIARAELVHLDVQSVGSRYLGGPAPHVSVPSAVASFRASAPAAAVSWPDLAAMLDTTHVNADRVSYPPGAFWGEVGTELFDEGYEFWKRSSGREVDVARQLVTLASPRELDQYLKIERN